MIRLLLYGLHGSLSCIIAMMLWTMTGCGEARHSTVTQAERGPEKKSDSFIPAKPADGDHKQTKNEVELDQMRSERDDLKGRLAALEPKIEDKEKAVAGERLSWVRWICLIISGLAVIGVAVMSGLAVWLRSKMFAMGALAALGVLFSMLATNWVLDHIELEMTAIAVVAGIGVLIGLYELYVHRSGFIASVKVAEALKPKREFEVAKAERKRLQASIAGSASKYIDRLRAQLGILSTSVSTSSTPAVPTAPPPAPPTGG